MRMRAVVPFALAAGLLSAGQAAADTRVTYLSQSGTLRVESLSGGMKAHVEGFIDSSRNGIRVRSLDGISGAFTGAGVSTQDELDCLHNPALNDVVCDGPPAAIFIAGGSAPDVVLVGGSNLAGCGSATGPVATSGDLGPGDDRLQASGLCAFPPGTVQPADPLSLITARFTDMHGGADDDVLLGGPAADQLFGDIGEDELSGSGGADTLDGGLDDDRLFGGGGDDVVLDDGNPTGADRIRGGPGRDVLKYVGPGPYTVTLGGGADDGAPGEGDDVMEVEVVTTNNGNDRIVGSDASEELNASSGDDEVTGGGGKDVLIGGPGNDVVDSRDAAVDTVSCGTGKDAVIADLVDPVVAITTLLGQPTSAFCEQVVRFATDDGPPGRVTGSRVAIGPDGATLRVACPRDARVDCRGRLRVRGATGARRAVGGAAYEVARGRTGRVVVPLPGAVARTLRAAGTVVVTTRETGASRKGPRSSEAVLAVR